jgi:exopolyphosphatase/guanosine-5'-triphosphate,3'-diphosphate pyrophosphatase
MKKRLAAIDFGTNTARLLIADRLEQGGFEQVHLQREIVRMGGGFSREVGLSPDAIQRGLACLSRFAEQIREHEVASVRAVATSAIRDALNGSAFVAGVRQKTGIELEVIDGVLEGNLTLAGVMAGLDQEYDQILVMDVGGGSTEYTLARSGRADFVSSLPLGVVRLTEGKESVAAMQQKIARELDKLWQELVKAGHRPSPGMVLVGTAGTATTLAAISMGMTDYDYRKVNNSTLTRDQIHSIYQRLQPMTPAERLEVAGLEKGREDLIIAGMLIFLQSMELFGIESIRVSDFGLLEGLILAGELRGA